MLVQQSYRLSATPSSSLASLMMPTISESESGYALKDVEWHCFVALFRVGVGVRTRKTSESKEPTWRVDSDTMTPHTNNFNGHFMFRLLVHFRFFLVHELDEQFDALLPRCRHGRSNALKQVHELLVSQSKILSSQHNCRRQSQCDRQRVHLR